MTSIKAVVALLLGATTASAQTTFDGVVVYQATGMADRTVRLVIMAKGARVREEATAAGMAEATTVTLTDYATGNITTLLPERRGYITSQSREPAMARWLGEQPEGGQPYRVVATGRFETIAGISCRIYTFDDGDAEACVATDRGHFVPVEGDHGAFRQFPDGALPLRMVFAKGPNRITFTATRVEARSLPDSLFRVPPGYTAISRP